MNSLFLLRPNPFRFLLYTEWALLAIVAVVEILSHLFPSRHSHSPLAPTLLILALLGLMGLILPSGRQIYKILYTGTEFGLILVGVIFGHLQLLAILYLIVVIRACFIFELSGRRVVAGLVFVIFLFHQLLSINGFFHSPRFLIFNEWERFLFHILTNTLLFTVGILFILELVNTVLSERKTWQTLLVTNQKLQEYALQVEELAKLQERNRIARDIHDSLGHSLMAMNIQLQGAMKLWAVDLEQAKMFLSEAQRLGELSMQEVRQSVSVLRTDALQQQSLEAAIQSLVNDFYKATGLLPSVKFNLETQVSGAVVTAIYRIVQEALTNISKHAKASRVEIKVTSTSTTVCVTIKDNGKGFNLEQKPGGFGLQGIGERVAEFQGRFAVESKPGFGCKIKVEIPL